MKWSVLLGRFGPLVLSLNYTWLFITLLGLWGLALLWIPDNFPGHSGAVYWLAAILIMALYLATVIMRELLRALVGRFSKRGVTLYPFGAAAPYRLDEIGTGRMIISIVAAMLFSLLLGIGLLALADIRQSSEGFAGLARAVLIPLGWINLFVGVVNLIPGIPFDGGRLLTNILHWFSGERERGLLFTRVVGEITSLGMVVAGAYVGLSSQEWIIALALVIVGWAAREAEEKGKQLNLLRNAMSELTVRDVMTDAAPADAISAESTVADLVYKHPYYAPDAPLAVTADGAVMGVVTLSKAEALLQGDWPTTPVTAVMDRPGEMLAVTPDMPLSRVVSMVEKSGVPPDEQPAIPVLDGSTLVGSLDPSRLAAFEAAEIELDAPEAPYNEKGGFWDRVRGLVGPTTLLALLAIAGSIALNSDPYAMRTRGIAPAPVTFVEISPEPGAVLSPGDVTILFTAIGVTPVTTASITLDGQPLQPIMTEEGTLRRTINASTVVVEGQHTVVVFAADRAGNIGRTEWQFWAGVPTTPTPDTGGTVTGPAAATIIRRVPEPGALRLAGSDVAISLLVEWDRPAQSAALTVDGKDVPALLEGLPDNRFRVSGMAPAPGEGTHSAAVTLQAEGGVSHTTEWTFESAVPDDSRVYFQETGYFVASDFYTYWQEHGGLELLGLPISDRMREVDEATGEEYIAQYFERARIEKHPALDNVIVMGRLAAMVHAPEPAVGPIEGARYFPETGHNVSGPFLAFWEGRGGLAVFGYPITEELKETDPQSGNEYLVQYFERARFEYHPEFAGTPNEVLLGHLGVQVYEQRLNR